MGRGRTKIKVGRERVVGVRVSNRKSHLPVSCRVQSRIGRPVNVLDVRGVNRRITAQRLVPAH
jgi:hypothetical protein